MKSRFKMRMFLAGLRLQSWLMPRAAAARALNLFLTPTKIGRPASEEFYFDSAKKFAVTPGIAAYEWGMESGPLALLVHGWNGRGTQMGPFIELLVVRGYRVVAIDAPAHGGSEGKTTNVGMFANTLLEVQSALGPMEIVIAHSMGAGGSVVALRRGMRVKRMVLIAGPSQYQWIVDNFFKAMKLSPRAEEFFIELLEEKIGMRLEEMNVADMIREAKVPALLVHDKDDKEVTYEAALEIKNAWPEVEFFTTEKLGHRRVLKDSKVLDEVARFIDRSKLK